MALIKGQPPVVSSQRRQSERDCVSMLSQLQAADAVARRWAARDLVACPDSTGALLQRLRDEPVAAVREVIFTTLIRLADAQVVAGLVELLRCQCPALRNEAIEALKRLPEQVAPLIQSLLTDHDSDVRIFAVNILESLRHPQVEQWLCAVIEQDEHVNVCGTAVDLLGEVGSANALDSLLLLKQRFASQPYIQFAADLAIKRIQED